MANTSYPTGAEVLAWCGAITPTSFIAIADFTQTVKAVAIVVSLNADMSNPVYTSGYQFPATTTGVLLSYKTCIFSVTGLTPGTKYYWQLNYLGAASQAGVVRSLTLPAVGPFAHSFAFGSCSANVQAGQWVRSAPVYRSIAADNPLFFLSEGDTPYSEVSVTTPLQRDYWRQWRWPAETAFMFSSVPALYIPSDHDYGSNDISLDTPNAAAIFANSQQTFREIVPSYPLALSGLLTQVADIGQTRQILLDAYAASSYASNTCLGSTQLAWLADQLANPAVGANGQPMEWIFISQGRTFTGGATHGWTDAFPAELKTVCDMIEACMIPVCMITGDAHASAFDDGTNTASTTDGFGFFPQVLCSGLYQVPNPAGSSGPYSWNGAPNFYNFSNATVAHSVYALMTMSADNKSWTATVKGDPIDPSTFAPTVIASVSSTDVTRAVSFNNTSPSVAHGGVLTVDLNVTWFGKASVAWSGNGQSGTVQLKPNSKRTSFTVNAPGSAGSFQITLSSPSGCTISGSNPITVTVT